MEEEVQIRHFKLINGDQIIAAVNSKNKDNWFLGTPVQVSNALLGGFSFSPWFPFSKEDNYKVKFHNVVQSTQVDNCLLYTSPSPRDVEESRMPSSA